VHDDIIMAEMEAAATAGDEVGAFTTPIDPEVLLLAKQKLMKNHVSVRDGQVYAGIDSVSWNVCLGFKQFANSDWQGPNLPFVSGALAKTWNGINVFVLDDELFPRGADNTELNAFMWHKSAFGFGSLYNPPMRASGAWQENRSGWLHTLRHRYGAKALQPNGIIRMKGDYDPAHISLTA
ncbi:MAG: phage capsid protein, partial [Hyphomicrobiales bacterium]|nr:phage capsid protein [Hyphomicrobiales bacterium]